MSTPLIEKITATAQAVQLDAAKKPEEKLPSAARAITDGIIGIVALPIIAAANLALAAIAGPPLAIGLACIVLFSTDPENAEKAKS